MRYKVAHFVTYKGVSWIELSVFNTLKEAQTFSEWVHKTLPDPMTTVYSERHKYIELITKSG